ncbi:hypothetical protein [Spiroplasma endosymbiont of Apeira syringaria]|uniref:hypothetical protein n=1 Tax=Spiroplasma endosymbiont of Apeira syringaria TaxID=3066307 RepID=UPI0030CC2B64
MTSSNFKGKNLTDIYDWNVNEIFKRCGIHIPSQKKSAQQSVPESTAVNISTINYIEQKLWQFNIDILKFIQILVRMDKDLLNSKTFNINDEQEINNLTVKLKLFNPENNQRTSPHMYLWGEVRLIIYISLIIIHNLIKIKKQEVIKV